MHTPVALSTGNGVADRWPRWAPMAVVAFVSIAVWEKLVPHRAWKMAPQKQRTAIVHDDATVPADGEDNHMKAAAHVPEHYYDRTFPAAEATLREVIEQALITRTPVVVHNMNHAGGVREWPAWSDEELSSAKFANVSFVARGAISTRTDAHERDDGIVRFFSGCTRPSDPLFNSRNLPRRRRRMGFKEYFARARNEFLYAANIKIHKEPSLQAELPVPTFLRGLFSEPHHHKSAWYIYLAGNHTSGRRSSTMLHWDDAEGLLFHRRGRKRVLLWPPEQLGALGHMNYSRFCNAVPVDPFDLDDACARYGDFLCRARPVEAILNPNDLLYIPWGWPHYVLQETQARQPLDRDIFLRSLFSFSLTFHTFLVRAEHALD